jgi:hypothetical protein
MLTHLIVDKDDIRLVNSLKLGLWDEAIVMASSSRPVANISGHLSLISSIPGRFLSASVQKSAPEPRADSSM